MRIIFVRHGHPNYQDDCLTELGKLQAEAVAERLKDEPITKFYSSTSGRAFETGSYIAKRHNLEIEGLDFMREIGWRSRNGEELPHEGHPWLIADDVANDNISLLREDWAESDYYNKSIVSDFLPRISDGLDAVLAKHGYKREGMYYRAIAPTDETIALTSHGGSSSIALAHIFNLPLPFVLATTRPQFTSITIVNFHGKEGQLFQPRIEVLNDYQHIKGIEAELVISN